MMALWAISVPSSSGRSLQLTQAKQYRLTRNNFSPLFIGEVPSTRPRVGVDGPDRHFSPLFIGEVPSTHKHDASMAAFDISVPSSSGRSLQLDSAPEAQQFLDHFSPLFIGEVPSTDSWEMQVRGFDISVPSSSGRSLQPCSHLRGRRHTRNFSPLFIGEVPSTAHFAPCFQQDMSLARRISSKTPNLQETPGGLRKSGPLVRCLYVCQGLPPR